MIAARDHFFSLSEKEKRTPQGLTLFVETIKTYYRKHRRPFSWRDNPTPYAVFVSEVMLQQTQTHRVRPKFESFTRLFPSFEVLAVAPLVKVLAAWQGLGYNRRAKFLKQSAEIIMEKHGGTLPKDPVDLVELPGIGPATASSLAAFAYNVPTTFIETNVRTVFIHFFCSDKKGVHDKELLPLIAQTLDRENPRDWYYALMDYGVMLKKQLVNPSRQSKHHVRQSRFEGSDRQIRGAIVRLLTTTHAHIDQELLIDEVCLHPKISAQPTRVQRILEGLLVEQMVQRDEQSRIFIPH
ncbi:MAG: A/G-specific adenine glycosylase [Candidatus Dependentiae bacterium]|jgi:A/G-specific adenine glycosylase